MGRMMKAFPIGSTGPMTSKPFTHTTTIKEFNRGMMKNGTHFDKWIRLEVTLSISTRKTTCYSCRRDIAAGEMVGDGTVAWDGIHCTDCIEIPEGIVAMELSYSTRKNQRHPDGIERITVFGRPEAIQEYANELMSELKRGVKTEIIPLVTLATLEPTTLLSVTQNVEA